MCKSREGRRALCDSGWGTPDGRSGCEREIFVSDFAKNRLRGWLGLQPVALLEGAGMGNSGGGGPERECVGSWNLGNRLPGGQRELEGPPLAGNSERKCLENCGLRCLYNTVLLASVAKMSLKTPS